MHHNKHNYWEGKTILPIALDEKMTITQLVDDVFDGMGYNAKRLAQACHLFKSMLDENSTVCLTLAGAMTPVGMGGGIIKMMEKGFVVWSSQQAQTRIMTCILHTGFLCTREIIALMIMNLPRMMLCASMMFISICKELLSPRIRSSRRLQVKLLEIISSLKNSQLPVIIKHLAKAYGRLQNIPNDHLLHLLQNIKFRFSFQVSRTHRWAWEPATYLYLQMGNPVHLTLIQKIS